MRKPHSSKKKSRHATSAPSTCFAFAVPFAVPFALPFTLPCAYCLQIEQGTDHGCTKTISRELRNNSRVSIRFSGYAFCLVLLILLSTLCPPIYWYVGPYAPSSFSIVLPIELILQLPLVHDWEHRPVFFPLSRSVQLLRLMPSGLPKAPVMPRRG